jgi:hypothetical protein
VHTSSPESDGCCSEEPCARIEFNFQLLLAWAGWAVPIAQVKSRVRRLLLGGAMHTNQIQFPTVAGLGGVGCATCTSQVQSPTVAAWRSLLHESNSISNCCWPGRGGLCHVHKSSPEANGCCLEKACVAARKRQAHEASSICNCCWPGRGGLCPVHKSSPWVRTSLKSVDYVFVVELICEHEVCCSAVIFRVERHRKRAANVHKREPVEIICGASL